MGTIAEGKRAASRAPLVMDDILAWTPGPMVRQWVVKDALMYALAVGSTPDTELDFVYERRGPKVLPSMTAAYGASWMVPFVFHFDVNLGRIYHFHLGMDQFRELPPEAVVKVEYRTKGVYDTGRHMVVSGETVASDEAGPLCRTVSSMLLRDIGGFGGPAFDGIEADAPDRAPDAVFEDWVHPSAMAWLRLMGDIDREGSFPDEMHMDPDFCEQAGLGKPFYAGSGTYGYACRAVVQTLCDGDPARFGGLHVQFTNRVYTSDKLITKLWTGPEGTYVLHMENQAGDVVLEGVGSTLAG